MPNLTTTIDVVERSELAALVAAENAAEVDKQGRFPAESVAALHAYGLLGALVPVELGGEGAPPGTAAKTAFALGRACSSTAMILAVHQAQVVSLVRHGNSDAVRAVLEGVSSGKLVTSVPAATSAPTASSWNEVDGGRVHVESDAVLVPFGEFADVALIHAARQCAGDSQEEERGPEHSLVLCSKPALTLVAREGPSTLGLRGTCTRRFDVVADVDASNVLDGSSSARRTLSTATRVFVSAAQSGIGAAAVEKAHLFAERASTKRRSAASLGQLRGCELDAVLQQTRALVEEATQRLERELESGDGPLSADLVASAAFLADSVGRLTTEMVRRASSVCGIAAYREDSPFSTGRLVRDVAGRCLVGLGDDQGSEL